jgi:hypothetical protein
VKRTLTPAGFPYAEFYLVPDDLFESLKELREDLAHVPVRGENGQVSHIYDKIEQTSLLNREDKDLIWKCLSIVRNAFKSLEETRANRKEEKGYQWNMNWKHVRAEIDQVLEASRLLKLDPTRTRDAILASIFSDCAKNRKNFIVHNIHGAQAAELVLSQLLDCSNESDKSTIERVARAVREHQIAPPEFMASVVAIMICHRQALAHFDFLADDGEIDSEGNDADQKSKRLVRSIFKKITSPFEKSHLTPDLATIDFSPAERQLLVNIGIDQWYVPHPDIPDSVIAHAVIAGDHSVNYNHPEGLAKIALLRGPDTEEIFKDPTIHHSLESALKSFGDSFRVIRPEVQSLAVDGLRKTVQALGRVIAIMSELFSGLVSGPQAGTFKPVATATALARARAKDPQSFSLEEDNIPERAQPKLEAAFNKVDAILDTWYQNYGEIPFSPKNEVDAKPGPGPLPFWNAPLTYPPRDESGELIIDSLSELEQRQFLFASHIREIAVELLRAETWFFGSFT